MGVYLQGTGAAVDEGVVAAIEVHLVAAKAPPSFWDSTPAEAHLALHRVAVELEVIQRFVESFGDGRARDGRCGGLLLGWAAFQPAGGVGGERRCRFRGLDRRIGWPDRRDFGRSPWASAEGQPCSQRSQKPPVKKSPSARSSFHGHLLRSGVGLDEGVCLMLLTWPH